MTTWQWIPPTVLSGLTAVLAFATYRRQTAYMGWSLEKVLSGNEKLGVREVGVRRTHGPAARDVTLVVGGQSKTSGVVSPGAAISISFGGPVLRPSEVKVTWRGRFGRMQSWHSST